MPQTMSMFAECGFGCGHWIFPAAAGLWVVTGLATLLWLNVVFRRYETTLALPIEYSAVQVCAVCSGLIFYDEVDAMAGWQLGVCIFGALVILLGVGIGRLPGAVVAVEVDACSTDNRRLGECEAGAAAVPCTREQIALDTDGLSVDGVGDGEEPPPRSSRRSLEVACDEPAAAPPLPRPSPIKIPKSPGGSLTLTRPFFPSPSPYLCDASRQFSPLVAEAEPLPAQHRTAPSPLSAGRPTPILRMPSSPFGKASPSKRAASPKREGRAQPLDLTSRFPPSASPLQPPRQSPSQRPTLRPLDTRACGSSSLPRAELALGIALPASPLRHAGRPDARRRDSSTFELLSPSQEVDESWTTTRSDPDGDDAPAPAADDAA